MSELLFLKLGGSLITDKTGVESARTGRLRRLAVEIAVALERRPGLRLLLGHGSGSFGHVPAAEHGTRSGVKGQEQWHGFSAVGASASKLNQIVIGELRMAGVPALSLPPSASASCAEGRLVSLATGPIESALDAGLVPVVHGDVAFDTVLGGTIVSTEEVMVYLVKRLPERLFPSWLLLAGDTDGVYAMDGQAIPSITVGDFAAVEHALGSARGTDVTGGMRSKVKGMLDLVDRHPMLSIRIFSGVEQGQITAVLADPALPMGTRITGSA